MISLHTSPLLQPGSGDSGGMNVYVREVASALAQAGIECTTYTRADRPGLPREVSVEPGHRVVHVPAGPFDLPKEALADEVDEFTAGVLEHIRSGPGVDVVHGNYWLSGVVGHRLKHELGVPLVATFHTLARVKAEGGDLEPEWRDRAEAEVIGCSDAICVSCPEEERQFRRLYGDPAGRIEIVPPAVEHAFFAPGDRRGARRAVGLPVDRPVLLFVGRIQPLKAPDVAIRALALLPRRDAVLVIVGGASGLAGDVESEKARQLAVELGVADRVRVRAAAAAPHPVQLLPGRRPGRRAEPQRELRPRRPGGGGVRHPGRRQRRRRAAQHRPRRRHRHPRRRPGPGPLRPGDGPAARRPGRRGGDGRGGGRAGPPVHVELHGGPAAAGLHRPGRPHGPRAGRLFLRPGPLGSTPVTDVYDDGALAVLERQIDEWLATIAAGVMPVEAIERGEGDERRWYVRLRGEDKDYTTIWLTLGQRTLRYETYVMPAPEENDGALYEHLLRRNERLVGAHFSIGIEDAVFLRGELGVAALNEAELDRVIGTLYATVEQTFQGLLRIGFASRFA